MFDSRSLQTFLCVIDTGSIRKAARALGRAPSAVSRQISALEHAVGRPLLHRLTDGIEPTIAAREVIEFARRRANEEAELRARLDMMGSPESGEIRLMCGRGFLADLMAGALQGFCASFPDMRFDIRTGSSSEMIEALKMKRADLALVFNPPPVPGVLSVVSHRQPLRLIAPADHPLASAESLRLADVAQYPAAMLSDDYGIRALLRQVEQATGCSINAHTITNSIDCVRRFARSGLGITFLPGFCIEGDDPELKTVRLLDPALRNAQASILIPDRTESQPLVSRLISHLSEHMSAYRG